MDLQVPVAVELVLKRLDVLRLDRCDDGEDALRHHSLDRPKRPEASPLVNQAMAGAGARRRIGFGEARSARRFRLAPFYEKAFLAGPTCLPQ